MAQNFQELLIRELREYLRPVMATQGKPEAIFQFLKMIGWHMESILPQGDTQFTAAFNSLRSAVAIFAGTTTQSIEDFADLVDAFDNVQTVVDAVRDLQNAMPALSQLPAEDLVGDVLNALCVIYLHRNQPLAFEILRLLTVIDHDSPEVDLHQGKLARVRNRFARLRFNRIADIIGDPEGALRDAYWPQGIPDRTSAIAVADKLFPRVISVLNFVSEQAPITASMGTSWMDFSVSE